MTTLTEAYAKASDHRSKSKPNKATKVLLNLNAREAHNQVGNYNRLENMKKRLLKRRQQEGHRRNEARSVENFPRGLNEQRLSNGYIAAFACGPLKRARYINERMEVELANFKLEVAKRFSKSEITHFTFPRNPSLISEAENTQSSHHGTSTTNASNFEKNMIEKWKTIDNYYQKKIMYKANKTQTHIPSQGTAANKKIFIENGIEAKDYETQIAPKIQNASTRSKIPESLKFDTSKLRESNFHDIYGNKHNKSVESSRNHTQKSNLLNQPIDQISLSNGVSRKSKSKDGYSNKNKTFEFPNNYLKSVIKSNTESMVQEPQNKNQLYATMIKNYNRGSSKKKRSARRSDLRINLKRNINDPNKNKEMMIEAKRLESIRKYMSYSNHSKRGKSGNSKKKNNITSYNGQPITSIYPTIFTSEPKGPLHQNLVMNNSRNINDKIYRSGTEEMALYKVGPHTNRQGPEHGLDMGLFMKTQGYGRNTAEGTKPQTIRKRSMNKQASKNSMLFNLVPSYTVSVDSSANLGKKKQHHISTNHSNSNNLILQDKNSNSKLMVEKANRHFKSTICNNYGKPARSDRYRTHSKTNKTTNMSERKSHMTTKLEHDKKRAESISNKQKAVFALGMSRRKHKKGLK